MEFPEDGYQGDYMKDLARQYLTGRDHRRPVTTQPTTSRLGRYAGDVILADIKQDLKDFGVTLRPLVQRDRPLRQGWWSRPLRSSRSWV